ncbi:MAG: glycosyltransferase family 9 protein [Pseudomonadota bacterium]
MNATAMTLDKPTAARANPGDTLKRVLVIKLGALGDFVQALGAMRIVRETHPSARITLLTTPPFAEFARACPYFDVVEDDGRQKEVKAQSAMIKRVKAARYDMVYDFQNNGRTERYYGSIRPRPLWSGAAKGASHRHDNPNRAAMHNFDRLAEQLECAGLGPHGVGDTQGWPRGAGPLPELSWVKDAFNNPPRLQPAFFGLPERFMLMIPGSSPEHPEKRWPEERFAQLATRLADAGVTPVVVGAAAEGRVAHRIVTDEPRAKNIVTRTDLFQLAALSEQALFSIGGDTGPMHMAAAAGRPGVCLFAQEWTPAMEAELDTIWNPETRLGRAAPKGAQPIVVVHAPNLEDVSVDDVWRASKALGVF